MIIEKCGQRKSFRIFFLNNNTLLTVSRNRIPLSYITFAPKKKMSQFTSSGAILQNLTATQ